MRGLPTSRLERLGRALGDDPPAVDDPDAVGELVGLLEVLGGEEDGRALVALRARTSSQSAAAADRVEAGGRLVEEEDARARGRAASARSRRRFMPPE